MIDASYSSKPLVTKLVHLISPLAISLNVRIQAVITRFFSDGNYP